MAGADLSGVLRDNQGNGLTGITVNASIYLTEGSTQLVTTTDAAGQFSLSGESGEWALDVPAAELNARGYFSVSGPWLTVTGQSVVRLTTRKLDFTHRISGRVIDEAGEPLAGYSLRARIWENNALFETNAVTGSNGSFAIAAVPAVWNLCCLEPPPGSAAENLFGERLVEVGVTNAEKQVSFVAPAATSTIAVAVTNLGGVDVVASAEAFGATYRLTQSVPCCLDSVINFRVFDGIWTISVTNGGLLYGLTRTGSGTPPEPMAVAVTNGLVSVILASVAQSGPTQQVQRVRTLTASGMIVSNASVSADLGMLQPRFPRAPIPLPPLPGTPPEPLDTPDVHDLPLPDGHWRLTASTANAPDWIGWSVTRQVTIVSNVAPPEVTLVFPEPNAGPQIFGTVRVPDGSGLPSCPISVRMMDGATNYSTSVLTDATGRFGIHVLPGRWQLQTFSGWYPLSSVIVLSNQDAQVDFEVSLLAPVSGAPVPVNVSSLDEGGPSVSDSWLSLLSGFGYLSTNASPGVEVLLRPGIWHTRLQTPYYMGGTDPYTLFPSLTWQLSPGAPTSLMLVARSAPARIEGRLKDEEGRLLLSGYAAAWTSLNGTNFWTSGAIASGYFSLNVFPGDWQVGAAVSQYPAVGIAENSALGLRPGTAASASPPTSYYTTPPLRWLHVSNGLTRCDFVTTNVLIPPAVSLTVTAFREDGGDLSGVDVSAAGAADVQTASADENGQASLVVAPGRLTISARLGGDYFTYEPLLWPSVSLDVTAPSNQVVLVLRQPTSCIAGTLSNAPALGLQPVLSSTSQAGATNYLITGYPDGAGHFCLPAIPGPWSVRINDSSLNDYGIQSVAPQEIVVPPTGQAPSVEFVLSLITGDFREARLMNPAVLPNGALQLELRGQTSLSWRVEVSNNLIDWMPVALEATMNGSFVIQEALPATDPATFYRTVWVQ